MDSSEFVFGGGGRKRGQEKVGCIYLPAASLLSRTSAGPPQWPEIASDMARNL